MIQRIKNKYLKDMNITKTKDKNITISRFIYIVMIIVLSLVILIWMLGRTFIERETVLKMNYQADKIRVTRVYTPFDKTTLKIRINGDDHVVPIARIPEAFTINQDKFIIYFDSKNKADSLSFNLH